MTYCKKCGGSVSPEEQYCRTCGNRVAQPKPYSDQKTSNRSKLVAGLLGVLIGSWGIHNFYLGNIGKGILQIFLTSVTFGIAGIWGFIEGILILCDRITVDGKGQPLV
ncbi:MAG: TM2 domain-containing protein [Clostridia bacterium]|nr:TM2 domain-containing protein [Clostridia bacterium]